MTLSEQEVLESGDLGAPGSKRNYRHHCNAELPIEIVIRTTMSLAKDVPIDKGRKWKPGRAGDHERMNG